MNVPLYHVDAFTDRLFGGNPAAVVVLEEWLRDEVLQAIAAENNLAETAFVIPRADGCRLRWFTPTVEMDLCGHATLAAAHVLFRDYFPSRPALVFHTQSGDLSVMRDGEILAMELPARPGEAVAVTDALVAAIGVPPHEVLRSRDLLVVLDSEADVQGFRPDFKRIASLPEFGLILTAPGAAADFVSRFFAPRAGIPEDPVTGSSQCTLVPYWAARLGRPKLLSRQISKRGGDLHCELRGDRVRIGGAATLYLRGEIYLE